MLLQSGGRVRPNRMYCVKLNPATGIITNALFYRLSYRGAGHGT